MRHSWIAALCCAAAAAQGTGSLGAEALRDLEAYLAGGGAVSGAASRPFAERPLSRDAAAKAAERLVAARTAEVRRERAAEIEGRYVERDGVRMKYSVGVFGERKTGRSLWISLHGGGSVPAATNDGQWRNQQRLYRPAEGLYVAPRAPTDAWNMWHVPHLDGLLDRLIETLVAAEGVDPDRVYLLGYSAGGDGVYQLAPRLADRFAAAAMMAGHPGDASPRGLRNLPFALYMGGKDAAFQRNEHARTWKKTLADLAAAEAGGYPHRVEILEAKGHWMDGEDAAILPWMAKFARDVRPKIVVWRQDDVVHDAFYWLAAEKPRAGAEVRAERNGQEIRLTGSDTFAESLAVRLDDAMLDLDREVTVKLVRGGVAREAFRGRATRTIATLVRSLVARGDVRGLFSAEISIRP